MKDRTAAIMTTVSFIGVVWLLWFANQVMEHHAVRDGPAFAIDSRVAVIYTPRSLIEFAKSHGTFNNHEELRKAVHAAGLSDPWLAVTYITQLSDGSSKRYHMIIYPASQNQVHLFPHVGALLAIVSDAHTTGINKVKISIIDDRRLDDDPVDVVADMEEAGK